MKYLFSRSSTTQGPSQRILKISAARRHKHDLTSVNRRVSHVKIPNRGVETRVPRGQSAGINYFENLCPEF